MADEKELEPMPFPAPGGAYYQADEQAELRAIDGKLAEQQRRPMQQSQARQSAIKTELSAPGAMAQEMRGMEPDQQQRANPLAGLSKLNSRPVKTQDQMEQERATLAARAKAVKLMGYGASTPQSDRERSDAQVRQLNDRMTQDKPAQDRARPEDQTKGQQPGLSR
jgi:hypothetical protein